MDPSISRDTGTVLIVTSILTFLTMVVKMLYDWFAADRLRRWQIEDTEHKRRVITNQEDMKEELHTNTQLSEEANKSATAAYNEANTINMKIAAIGNVRRTNGDSDNPVHRAEDKKE